MRTIAIDTETTGLNVWKGDRPFAVSMCCDKGETFYWEWSVNPRTRTPKIPRKTRREIIDITNDPSTRKAFWHAKFDIRMLRAIGIPVVGQIAEVQFMLRNVYNIERMNKLKPLAKKYAKINANDEELLRQQTIIGRRVARRLGWNVAEDVEADYWIPNELIRRHPRLAREAGIIEGVCETYATLDAERTIVMYELMMVAMQDVGVVDRYEEEMRLLPITMAMEDKGVAVDMNAIERAADDCLERLNNAKDLLAKATGNPEFNPNSNPQVAKFLFTDEGLDLDCVLYTDAGNPSAGAEALLPYKQIPEVRAILEARANSKALSSFFNKYKELVCIDEDGERVLHPDFRQCGTVTTRYACATPNLQQVSDPTTTNSRLAEFVVDVKQAFVPRRGKWWLCSDYDQLEVLIFADLFDSKTMLDAIARGQDIHTATAERIYGGHDNERAVDAVVALGDVIGKSISTRSAVDLLNEFDWRITVLEKSFNVSLWRKRAKSVTFTKIFAGGVGAVMSWVGCDKPTAQKLLEDYDAALPDISDRIDAVKTRACKDGFIVNPFGMLLRVDPFNDYKIVNHYVQSTAACLIKNGMLNLHEFFRRDDVGIRARDGDLIPANEVGIDLLLQIHDELVHEVDPRYVSKSLIRRIQRCMSDHGGRLRVPITVETSLVTERWSKKCTFRTR